MQESVEESLPTIQALAAMRDKAVSALAVVRPSSLPHPRRRRRLHAGTHRARPTNPRNPQKVDEAGALVGNLSVADLRGITPPHLDVLALPVGEFLRETHGVAPKWGARKAPVHTFFDDEGAKKRKSKRCGGGGGSALARVALALARSLGGDSGRLQGPEPAPFPRRQRTDSSEGGGGGSELPLVVCHRATPLATVVRRIVDNNVHRVFVARPVARPPAHPCARAGA